MNPPVADQCEQCGKPLRPAWQPRVEQVEGRLQTIKGRVPRFCRGSRCRSAWHAEHKRRHLSEVLRHIEQALIELADRPGYPRPISARIELQEAVAKLTPLVRKAP